MEECTQLTRSPQLVAAATHLSATRESSAILACCGSTRARAHTWRGAEEARVAALVAAEGCWLRPLSVPVTGIRCRRVHLPWQGTCACNLNTQTVTYKPQCAPPSVPD